MIGPVKIVTAAGRGVVAFATMAMVVLLLMRAALLLAVMLLLLLLLVLRVMMVMVMMMVVMVVIQRGRGRRGRGQSGPTRTGRRAAGTSAERRRRFHRLHLGLHQGGENGLETRHLHAASATAATGVVRRHRFVGDVGGNRRRRHRHLVAAACHLRRRHIGTLSLIGGDRRRRGDRRVAIVCGAGTIGPLPKRSQDLPLLRPSSLLPFPRLADLAAAPVLRRRQFLQEARQHHKRAGSASPCRGKRGFRSLSPSPLSGMYVSPRRSFASRVRSLIFERNFRRDDLLC